MGGESIEFVVNRSTIGDHEIIMPGAFEEAIKKWNGNPILYNHEHKAYTMSSKIKRSDIISEDAINASIELAKALTECAKHMRSFQRVSGWYPKNEIPAKLVSKKVHAVYNTDFNFVVGLLIGVIVGALVVTVFLIN